MIPRVFVSSTIRDLQHVRDAVRELIVELGYQPAMSEHGEVGYLPNMGAADACYREAKDCDFGILIIGKRYGDEHLDGVSVTHNEYRTLASGRIPIVTVVEKDLLSFNSIFKANSNTPLATFPGMDKPEKTFAFLSEVMKSPHNNGVAEFAHIGEARSYVRLQLAHLFGSLLRDAYDPVKSEVKDILAEVRSLRNELTKNANQDQIIRFLRASRVLLDDKQKYFREFLEKLFGDQDQPARAILVHSSFEELISSAGWTLKIVPIAEIDLDSHSEIPKGIQSTTRWVDRWTQGDTSDSQYHGGYAMLSEKRVWMNDSAKRLFGESLDRCRAALEI